MLVLAPVVLYLIALGIRVLRRRRAEYQANPNAIPVQQILVREHAERRARRPIWPVVDRDHGVIRDNRLTRILPAVAGKAPERPDVRGRPPALSDLPPGKPSP